MGRFNRYIKKVKYNDITFDSQEELDYYLILVEKERKGEITGLDIHRSFELQEAFTLNGKKIKAITYEADFVYWDEKENIGVAIDVKGYADDVFLLKKKLFDYKYQLTFPNGLQVMKYSKSTGWVNYDDYKKARASYKKRLLDEKNKLKKELEQNQKQAIRDTKLYNRYISLLDKQNNAKLTTYERNRLQELETYFKDKLIITAKEQKQQ